MALRVIVRRVCDARARQRVGAGEGYCAWEVEAAGVSEKGENHGFLGKSNGGLTLMRGPEGRGAGLKRQRVGLSLYQHLDTCFA